jgi:hypothetical protein
MDIIMFWIDDKSRVHVCLVLIGLAFLIGIFPAYGIFSPSTFFKGDRPYGIAYDDWMTKWWQWNVLIPKDRHPVTSNPTKCPVGQSGPVSFLTHSIQGESNYNCTIPAGHAILVPIATGECTSDEAKSTLPADMIKCATEGDKYIHFEATIDGTPLNGLDQNYAVSKIFNMTVPSNNFMDVKPGVWTAVTGGYFIFLKPLPAGIHNLSISARVTNPIDPSYNYNYHTLVLMKVQ